MLTRASFHITVTDLNHHVRDLLRRELAKEGYTVTSVDSRARAGELLIDPSPLDLIILDPEVFPGLDQSFFTTMLTRRPQLKILIHTYADGLEQLPTSPNIQLIEKCGQSLGPLKAVIDRYFEEFRGDRRPASTPA